ncbi:hypothetical protein ACIBBE_44575 [Streptomyces sp. NPDC051644]|uniref:hypothetical protein n=1 Tax=Streptomyces sp. NPDC051644 TaxID=3365666 RepID=UPI003789D96D
MLVVLGRDSVGDHGSDPLAYQASEPELASFRADPHGRAGDVRRIDIGRTTSLTESTHTLTDVTGSLAYVRNRVLILGDRFQLIQVLGPATRREQADDAYERAVDSYRPIS